MIVTARMLTPASAQVNEFHIKAGNMNQSGPVLESTVNSLIGRLRPQRLLIVSAHPASLPLIRTVHNCLVVRIETDGMTGHGSLQSRTESLPFEDGAFNMVIMHHVFSNGQEPELDEVQRVVAGHGQLLAIGRGRFGLPVETGETDIPNINARVLCQSLKQRAFEIRQCEGIGFRGRAVHWQKPWQQLAFSFNDLVLIRGQHKQHKPVVTRLRFSQPQAAGVGSAVPEALNRQGVA